MSKFQLLAGRKDTGGCTMVRVSHWIVFTMSTCPEEVSISNRLIEYFWLQTTFSIRPKEHYWRQQCRSKIQIHQVHRQSIPKGGGYARDGKIQKCVGSRRQKAKDGLFHKYFGVSSCKKQRLDGGDPIGSWQVVSDILLEKKTCCAIWGNMFSSDRCHPSPEGVKYCNSSSRYTWTYEEIKMLVSSTKTYK